MSNTNTQDNPNHSKFRALREQAEQIARVYSNQLPTVDFDDVARLLHEVQVHQVELELQNEELRRTQAELQASRDEFAHLYNFAPVGYLTLDPDGLILEANVTAARLLGVPRRQLTGKPFSTFVAPNHHTAFYLHRSSVINTNVKQTCELELRNRQERTRFIQLESTVTLPTVPGQQAKILSAILDITGRRVAAEKLESNERYFRALIENSSDIIWVVNKRGSSQYISPSVEKLLGYQVDELLNHQFFDLIHPAKRAAWMKIFFEAAAAPQTLLTTEVPLKHKSSGWRTFVCTIQNLLDNPDVQAIIINSHDITLRQRIEKELKASVEEKEVLLKEIHHRVKNNLQIIHSLLSLQSDYFTNEKILEALRDSRHRVRSMALVHEKLYQSADLAHIDSAGYIQSLVTQLFDSFQNPSHPITFEADIDNTIMLNVDQAIPCGLIINELVTNSLKHAFVNTPANHQAGKVTVKLFSSGNNQATLVVSDNGSGIPPNFDFQNARTMGLQLVNMLAMQLDGKLETMAGPPHLPGMTVEIVFSLDK